MSLLHRTIPVCILLLICLLANPLRAESQLTLLFAGDLMGHINQIEAAQVAPDQYDYRDVFEHITPLVQKADLAIANLEMTLATHPPYSGFPRFRTPVAFAKAIKACGFQLLSTANNHSNDAGKQGLVTTLNQLDKLKLLHTGTFRTKAERQQHYPLLITRKGFRLAFLNYSYGTNHIPTEGDSWVNLIDEEVIKEDMARARGLNPDAIIVLMHWGREYQLTPTLKQKNLTKQLWSWGANIIIGTHPHVLQPVIAPIVNGKKRVVAYSLGNCISGQHRPNTDFSILLEIELNKQGVKRPTHIAAVRYHPIWRYHRRNATGRDQFMVLPATPPDENSPLYQLPPHDLKQLEAAGMWINKFLKPGLRAN